MAELGYKVGLSDPRVYGDSEECGLLAPECREVVKRDERGLRGCRGRVPDGARHWATPCRTR